MNIKDMRVFVFDVERYIPGNDLDIGYRVVEFKTIIAESVEDAHRWIVQSIPSSNANLVISQTASYRIDAILGLEGLSRTTDNQNNS